MEPVFQAQSVKLDHSYLLCGKHAAILTESLKASLEEEKALIQELNKKQMAYISPCMNTIDSSDIQQDIHFIMEKLNTIWDQLAMHYPEYVELRRGSTINYSMINSLLN